jgi:argininosuccinate synthase
VTHMQRAKSRVVFACSGSAESIDAIARLASTFDADVVALTLDVGQPRELEGVRQAALAAGAVRAHVLDAREEFARHCIECSFAEQAPRPHAIVARKLVEIARIEGATAIAHSGDEDDQAAIEAAAVGFDPSIRVVAANGGIQTSGSPAAETTLWQRSPGKPDLNEPARLEITFEHGLPVSVNGVPMTLTELIESVATIADASPAAIFQAAHEALGADASRALDATVCLELFKGQHRVLSAHRS